MNYFQKAYHDECAAIKPLLHLILPSYLNYILTVLAKNEYDLELCSECNLGNKCSERLEFTRHIKTTLSAFYNVILFSVENTPESCRTDGLGLNSLP